jgi:gas vesicle protein
MASFGKGFLLGLFFGAALALLLSPGSGSENRALARERLRAALEAGREAARQEEMRLRRLYRRSVGATEER